LAAAPCASNIRVPLRKFLAQRLAPWASRDSDLVADSAEIANDGVYTLRQIELRGRLEGTRVLTWVAESEAAAEDENTAVVVQSPGTLPYQAFGVRLLGDDSLIHFTNPALLSDVVGGLLQRHYRVVSVLISDDISLYPQYAWGDIDRFGAAWFARDSTGSSLRIAMNAVVTAVDYAESLTSKRVLIMGWRETGANLASYEAATDARVSAVLRIGPILDRARMVSDTVGVASGPSFMTGDCELDDAETIAAIAPRPEAVVFRTGEFEDTRERPFVDSAGFDRAKLLYSATRASDRLTEIELKPKEPVRDRLDQWLAGLFAESRAPLPAPALKNARGRYPADALARLSTGLGLLVVQSPVCRPLPRQPGVTGDTVRLIDDDVLRGLRVDTLQHALAFDLVWARNGADGILSINTLLFIPRTGATGDVVVSFNGVDDLAALGGTKREATEYLNAYAARLANEGFTVVVPVLPNWYPEQRTSIALSKSHQMVSTIRYHGQLASRAVTVAQRLASAPMRHLAAYGISYGGYAALYYAVGRPEVNVLVYSNPVYTPSLFFGNANAGNLASWFADICASFGDVFVGYAPRPMIWENGARDINGPETSELEFVQTDRSAYERFGRNDSFEFRRHGGAHATRPDQGLSVDLIRMLSTVQ
jgi:pimeloyl-ACP methyl ester carboxylesterase